MTDVFCNDLMTVLNKHIPGADPAQNLTGFKGPPKKFWLPWSGEKKLLGPLGGSRGMLPQKILKI